MCSFCVFSVPVSKFLQSYDFRLYAQVLEGIFNGCFIMVIIAPKYMIKIGKFLVMVFVFNVLTMC